MIMLNAKDAKEKNISKNNWMTKLTGLLIWITRILFNI